MQWGFAPPPQTPSYGPMSAFVSMIYYYYSVLRTKHLHPISNFKFGKLGRTTDNLSLLTF